MAHAMGGDTPKLKAGLVSYSRDMDIFEQEMKANLAELQQHGLFFSFTTDPCLPETKEYTLGAMILCFENGVPVKVLTKCTEWITRLLWYKERGLIGRERMIAIGFTLTGMDKLEPNAAPNMERIKAMKELKEQGYKTFASIEPIIDIDRSLEMISKAAVCCDLFKVGIERGRKYEVSHLQNFMSVTILTCRLRNSKVYFKDSILKAAKIARERLPEDVCVTADYNLFENK